MVTIYTMEIFLRIGFCDRNVQMHLIWRFMFDIYEGYDIYKGNFLANWVLWYATFFLEMHFSPYNPLNYCQISFEYTFDIQDALGFVIEMQKRI